MPDINLTSALTSAVTSVMPVTDAEAARLASPAAFSELSRQITAQPGLLPQPDGLSPPATLPLPVPGGQPRQTRRPGRGLARPWSRRRTLLTGLPVAALAGAAALIIGLLVPGSGRDNGANSQAAIQALSFTKSDGYVTVTINNPYADAAWYNADLARHHLDVKLQLIPASPSLVGTPIGGEGTIPGIKYIRDATRQCYIASADYTGPCVIGFKIPAGYRGEASLWIGGPTRPGEPYDSTSSIFAPGEALAGLLTQVAGQPMSQVRAILASHHLTIADCRDKDNNPVSPDSVPGRYYVTNIMPDSLGTVRIWTSPRRFWQGPEHVPGLTPPAPSAPPSGG